MAVGDGVACLRGGDDVLPGLPLEFNDGQRILAIPEGQVALVERVVAEAVFLEGSEVGVLDGDAARGAGRARARLEPNRDRRTRQSRNHTRERST
jgi:hypothetical protein